MNQNNETKTINIVNPNTPVKQEPANPIPKNQPGSDSPFVIAIDHGYGFTTLYAHMQKSTVRVGQRVKRGEQVGTVGSSGMSSGSHLHYEVHLGDRQVDPVYYFFNDLSPEEYEDVLEQARKENQCMS